MKRIIQFMLIAAVAVSTLGMTACTRGEDVKKLPPREGRPQAPEEFLAYDQLMILQGEYYTLEVEIEGIPVRAVRNGQDAHMKLAGTEELFVDGTRIMFDHHNKKANVTYMASGAANVFKSVAGFSEMVQLDDAYLYGSGYAVAELCSKLKKMGELFYEDVWQKDYDIKRVFFDEDKKIVGIEQNLHSGARAVIPFRVSAEVDKSLFEIPDDYQIVFEDGSVYEVENPEEGDDPEDDD